MRAETNPQLGLRRDGSGNPMVSATFVLQRAPAPDERLGPLIDHATAALDLQVTLDGDASAGTVTFDAVRRVGGSPDEVLASQMTSNPFGQGAVALELDGGYAVDLFEALIGAPSPLDVVATIEPQTSTPPDPVRVRVALATLWRGLDRVADESRHFHHIDLVNYLPRLQDDGAVAVEAGPPDPASVVAAVLRAARWVLAPAPPTFVDIDTHRDLGQAYLLQPAPPGDMDVTGVVAVPAPDIPPVVLRVSVRKLVADAIAHNPSRYITAISLDGGRVEQLLPARRARSSRSWLRGRVTHIDSGTRVQSIATMLHPRPSLAVTALPPQLAQASFDQAQLAPITDVEFLPAPNRRPGPLVSDTAAPLWKDRWDDRVAWYLPELQLVAPASAVSPDKSPFRFDVERHAGHGPQGAPVISATVTVVLAAHRSAATHAAWKAAGKPELRRLGLDALSCQLVVPFRDEHGTERLEMIAADATEHDGAPGQEDGRSTVRFRLWDGWARLAYGALSTPDFQTQPAGVKVIVSFAGWRARLEPFTVAWLNKRRALGIAAGGPRTGRPAALPAVHATSVGTAQIHPAWRIEADRTDWLERLRRRVVHEWARFAVTRTVEAFVSCAEHGDLYRERQDGQWRAIGCRPALQLGQIEYRTYEAVAVASADGHAQVLRSLRSPGRFLVVPSRYTIGRHEPDDGDRAYHPIVLLHSTIDGDDPTRITCVLAASLRPDLPAFRREAIVDELRTMTHGEPTLEYIQDAGVAPDIHWAVPSNVDVDSVVTDVGVDLVCTTDVTGFLTLRSLLERDGIRGSIVAQLPAGVTVRSDLIASLSTVSGPFAAGPLQVRAGSDGSLNVTNHTGQRIALLGWRAQGNEIAVPCRVIDPDDTIAVADPRLSDDVVPVYGVEAGSEGLEEVRAYIEDFEVGVLFVAATDPSDAGLRQIDITTRFLGRDDADALTLTSEVREVERTYTLPLTTFVDDPHLEFTVHAVSVDGARRSGTPTSWAVRSQGALIPVHPPPP